MEGPDGRTAVKHHGDAETRARFCSTVLAFGGPAHPLCAACRPWGRKSAVMVHRKERLRQRPYRHAVVAELRGTARRSRPGDPHCIDAVGWASQASKRHPVESMRAESGVAGSSGVAEVIREAEIRREWRITCRTSTGAARTPPVPTRATGPQVRGDRQGAPDREAGRASLHAER